jgi:hypothetical protein
VHVGIARNEVADTAAHVTLDNGTCICKGILSSDIATHLH